MFGLGLRRKVSVLKNGYIDCSRGGFYEEDEFYKLAEAQALSTFLRRFDIDCVLDVGANRGQYATALRKNAGYAGHIVSLEPIPIVFEELARNAARDPLWHCENCALSDVAKQQDFHVMRGDQFSSFLAPTSEEFSLLEERNSISSTITVNAQTLAEVYEHWKKRIGFRRPFLKLDTQGYDHVILSSGGSSVSCFLGIQSEVAFKRLYVNALSFSEMVSFMDRIGFGLSFIFPNNAGHFPNCIEQDAIFFNRSFQPIK
ncbi:FkbM family methyltransferase [Bradyrhizobium sp. 157]|uniref:FkbM family methyltransferase n=1 Tax=Bradyrhizobium sp. 157 TaxID=2782631 RepID=UPI001FFB7D74|nr:FkbM family methyltransferase [Bradyrhizobium sp. 157]MCK1642988.1 FkbM family methyltransferase [Bradyrhizobium sp. 157]